MNKSESPTLRELREQNKNTAAEVAEVLGVSVRAVSRYEQGTRRIGLEQIIKLMDFYHCTAEEIIWAQLNSCQ
ncbi:MAG: transcriptional regulator [Clostridiales bacterium]|mgnify:FL=1|jgi:transcriptional regulator with XRE-family HTH domain|nr:MAG: transcriptional regulator [Clostridiales bacterium]PWM02065.1 MAG: transcriptional regulator [Clostridiales bacterium]